MNVVVTTSFWLLVCVGVQLAFALVVGGIIARGDDSRSQSDEREASRISPPGKG